MSEYFALPKETLQEVLKHLMKDPIANLYNKVANASPVTVTQTPAKATEPKDVTPPQGTNESQV